LKKQDFCKKNEGCISTCSGSKENSQWPKAISEWAKPGARKYNAWNAIRMCKGMMGRCTAEPHGVSALPNWSAVRQKVGSCKCDRKLVPVNATESWFL